MSFFPDILRASLARQTVSPEFADEQLRAIQHRLNSTIMTESVVKKFQAAHRFMTNVWPVLQKNRGYQSIYLHEIFDDVDNRAIDTTHKVDATLWQEGRALLSELGEPHALRTLWKESYERAIYVRLAVLKSGVWELNEHRMAFKEGMYKSTKTITSLTDSGNRSLKWSLLAETNEIKNFLKKIYGVDLIKIANSNSELSEAAFASCSRRIAGQARILPMSNLIWLAIHPESVSATPIFG